MIETLNSQSTIILNPNGNTIGKRPTILPNSKLSSYVRYVDKNPQQIQQIIPIPKQVIQTPPIPRTQILKLFQNEKVMLSQPQELENSINNLWTILNLAKNSTCEHGDILDMQAYLSQALWSKGDSETSNQILISTIEESTKYYLFDKWLEWTKWMAVRHINIGKFQVARELLEPIVLKLKTEYSPLSSAAKASLYNNYALSLSGIKLKENYQQAEGFLLTAIQCDPVQPIYLHNLSDLYKKYYLDFQENQYLEEARERAEFIYKNHLSHHQFSFLYKPITPVSKILFLNNLAEIYYLCDDLEKSNFILTQGFKECNSHQLFNEPCFARLYETESKILFKQGKLSEAKDSISAAIRIGKEKLKNSHHLERFEEEEREIETELLRSEIFIPTDESHLVEINHSFIEGLDFQVENPLDNLFQYDPNFN